MYRLFLALRYLRSRFVNAIAVGGVMVGVAVLIVVTSVFDGFQEQVRTQVRGTLSHLLLTPLRPAQDEAAWTPPPFADLERRLLAADSRIEAVSPQIRLPIAYPYRSRRLAWARMKQQAIHQLEAVGIDWEREIRVSDVGKNLIAGDPANPFFDAFAQERQKTTVLVGRTFAENMLYWGDRNMGRNVTGPFGKDGEPIYEGEEIEQPPPEDPTDPTAGFGASERKYANEVRIYLPRFKEDASTGELGMDQSSINPFVKGVIDMQDATAEMGQMYFDIAKLKELAGLDYDYFEVRVRLRDYREADAVRAVLQAKFPELVTETWEDIRRDFLRVVDTEKVMLVVVLSFIVLLGGFIILATLTLTVVEKTRDIGILGALGAPRNGILRIFLGNGLLIGVVGSALGVLLGWWFVQNVDGVRAFVAQTTGQDLFPPEFYHFRSIPTVWHWPTVLSIAGGSMAVAFFAGLLPALRAARLDPVRALRYE